MRIGIVSDTHAHLQNAQAAARMLQSLEVEAVLHCGDIGSPAIPGAFSLWPTHYVVGNVDHGEEDALSAAVTAAGGRFHGAFADFMLNGRRIALLHSDDARRFRRVTTGNEYDLVCYGHSHIAEQHLDGRTLVLNPGALYRANPHQIAVVDLTKLEAMHFKL
ncbi:phosphodiesterase [Anatilimnocola aggregata]|uniref:Phosphoesterase n=1 Tax=Anatilimnocola aggregata TaxID=2528021 RepID=A0A517YNM0_9BACT|nr:metallophosphoesterase family protein [Anatilimnocola aggregata]QDU31824.1 phosphodiesterase [Anatilimnocola aggregata]